ncbi:MAG: hypothetical protein H7844_15290 [Nitrospirae bacterium YQR-1]
MQSNFMLKVEDAKLPDIQKALKAASIQIKSIVEVFKEAGDDKGNEQTPKD